MVEPKLATWVASMLFAGMLIAFVVGVRLLRHASQTREVPELALGAFALTMALGNIGTVASMKWRLLLGPDAAETLAAIAQLLAVVGNVMLCFATRAVFRPGEGWALGAAVVASVVLFGGFAANLVAGGNPTRLSDPRPAVMLLQLARVGVFVWWSAESFGRAVTNRRRARFGLSDPSITYRLTMWAGFGLCGAIAHAALLAMGIFDGRDFRESSLVLVIVAATTVIGNVLVYVSFFPPAFLRRWERSGRPAEAGGG